jgi:hypothetical protein
MKTIKIKRPIEIPGATKKLTPKPAEPDAAPVAPVAAVEDEAGKTSEPDASVTQRKTLKISRPGAVRPAGKFGIKRPVAPTAVSATSDAAAEKTAETVVDAADIPEIADIPAMPAFTAPAAVQPAASGDGPAWLCAISAVVQLAACLAAGALAWYLFQDTQIATF